MPMTARALAIDFGTSNSLVASATVDGTTDALPLDDHVGGAGDASVMKSVLYTPTQGEWFFGALAVTEYVARGAEGRLLRSLKRFLPDPSFTGTTLHGGYVNLTELVATFLRVLRDRACKQLDADVTAAVFGRPALFSANPELDQLAEKRLETAATLAGFTSIRFCPEPVAAAQEFRRSLTEPKTVLVADFGGGTSDFTIARLGPAPFAPRDVLATHGIDVAGDRFDGALMRHEVAPHFGTDVSYRLPMGAGELNLPRHFVTRLCTPADVAYLARAEVVAVLKNAQRFSLSADDAQKLTRLLTLVEDQQGYRLFKAIEETKIALSTAPRAPFVFDYPGAEVEAEVEATRFVAHGAPLVERIAAALDETFRRAGVEPERIDLVCLTGGTAKLPALKAELTRRFGAAKMREHRHFHSVVGGLADEARTWLRA
jgi:hypothetical chaperone protein